MHIIISPAKKINSEFYGKVKNSSIPIFIERSKDLIKILKNLNITEIKRLMKVSDDIAKLNSIRFKNWKLPFNNENAKPAIFAFEGDVYRSLNIHTFNLDEIHLMQSKLSIISGLYGILRPLDLIQPYRLEMGTKLKNMFGNNLYSFWNSDITNELNKKETNYIVNLASNEYFKSIDKNKLKAKIITPIFKNISNGKLKVIGIFAKKARGQMTKFILQNKINEVEDIKKFNIDHYTFDKELSNSTDYIFTR
ncbi:MAG: peroxide stress protein YaaA [Flavobacteriales bacterium TMED288]|nr:peroxide stress protein YaaA [Flavobacteriales bacterium]RPG53723.1 MAG: peroxide stress protein YaaA [Flavobacteriales bacterium TMED288]|tara:strand:+ start:39 stop:791 length:753 start_codon:yes stop_codon:yes gene_type:complete